jgi:peptidoglycan/LPS O-acetylase OafA/YrhL
MRYRPTLTNLRRPHQGVRPAAPEAQATIAAQPLDRLEFLDSLRGIAALVVLLAHALEYSWAPYHELANRFQFGNWGVVLFFLCSGFIIPVSMERQRSLWRFWVRRFFRLYPLYWANIGLVVLCAATATGGFAHVLDVRPVSTLLANLTMFQHFLGFPHINLVYWSLSVEMVFYIMMTLLFALRLHTYTAPITIGLLLATICAELLLPIPFATSYLTHIVIIFVGTVLHRIHSRNIKWPTGALVVGLTLIMLIIPLFGDPWSSAEQAPWVLAQVSALVFFIACFLLRTRQTSPITGYLGKISYSLYLMHPIIMAVIPGVGNPIASTILWTGALLVFASATYRWIEQPAIAVGQRLTQGNK